MPRSLPLREFFQREGTQDTKQTEETTLAQREECGFSFVSSWLLIFLIKCRPRWSLIPRHSGYVLLMLVGLGLGILGVLCGCGYNVGPAFSPGVRTVAVPVFQSDVFRRGIEFQLTEAVHSELKLRGLQIAEAPYAETRLTGQIFAYRKDPLTESAFDESRELQLTLAVRVTWEDLRTGEILNQQEIALPPEAIALAATAEFAPEVGQSLATANQQVVDRLARDIVNKMEMPW